MKTLKLSLIVHLFVGCLFACAMGGKIDRSTTARKDQDKLWRPCQPWEDPRPGMLCSRRCQKRRKSGSCDEWETSKKNFCEQGDFNFFRTGTFVFIDEDNL